MKAGWSEKTMHLTKSAKIEEKRSYPSGNKAVGRGISLASVRERPTRYFGCRPVPDECGVKI